jgi:predicted amidohydrolase
VPFRIAVTQPSASADARSNGRLARELMRAAAAQGARLVQFPEAFLSGHAREQIDDWAEVDWAAVRDELGAIAALAADLGTWVVIGCAHPLSSPYRPHNSLYVISDRGCLVARYDKRYCSNAEILRFYSPGFDPLVFEIEGFRFGCAISIEINFPELFTEYERLGVDCVLLSAYPIDSMFDTKARAHAAINNYWLALSVPAQRADLLPASLIGPDGNAIGSVDVDGDAAIGLVVATMDRDDPRLYIPLNLARPWRAVARHGDIYRTRRVDDPRGADLTSL